MKTIRHIITIIILIGISNMLYAFSLNGYWRVSDFCKHASSNGAAVYFNETAGTAHIFYAQPVDSNSINGSLWMDDIKKINYNTYRGRMAFTLENNEPYRLYVTISLGNDNLFHLTWTDNLKNNGIYFEKFERNFSSKNLEGTWKYLAGNLDIKLLDKDISIIKNDHGYSLDGINMDNFEVDASNISDKSPISLIDTCSLYTLALKNATVNSSNSENRIVIIGNDFIVVETTLELLGELKNIYFYLLRTSNTVGNTELSQLNKLEVYPNPTSDYIHILNGCSNQLSFEIFSSIGKAVATGKINDEHTILPVTNYSTGVYFIKLTMANNQEFIKRIVIQ